MYEQELQDELDRRRYSAPLTLQFLLPIETQLDQGQFVIFKDLKHNFDDWQCARAGSSLRRTLPVSPGLYMFVWSPNAPFEVSRGAEKRTELPFSTVLYVGVAGDSIRERYDEYWRILEARRPEHLFETEDTSRAGRFQKYLSIYPLQFWYAPLTSNNQRRYHNKQRRILFLKNIEERVIRFFNPPINDQHTIKVNVGKEEEAWGGS